MKLLIVSRAAQPLFGTEATDVARWVSNLSSHSPSAVVSEQRQELVLFNFRSGRSRRHRLRRQLSVRPHRFCAFK